jgi:hypothetical protein
VISENAIVSVQDGLVTFNYTDSKTGKTQYRTLKGEDFCWLVLQHVLPNPDKPEPRRQRIFRQKEILGCTGKIGRSADSRPPKCFSLGRFK